MRVLGTTDEVTTCDCCGRTGLKNTVALDDGHQVVYYGVTCAARAAGRPAADIRRDAKTADAVAREAAEAVRRAASDLAFAAWSGWLYAQTGSRDVFTAIQALGGYASARALYNAAVAA